MEEEEFFQVTGEALMTYSNFLKFQRDKFALCPRPPSLRPLETSSEHAKSGTEWWLLGTLVT